MELQPCQGIDNTGYFFKVLLLGLLDCEEDESLGLGGILLVVVLLLKNVWLKTASMVVELDNCRIMAQNCFHGG